MTDVKYDAELCERLEREAREDAEAFTGFDAVAWHAACGRHHNNALAMADQLAAARSEIAGWRRKAEVALKLFSETQDERDAMRSVIEAAIIWRETPPVEAHGSTAPWVRAYRDLERAVDAYRAARDKAGR